MAGLHQRRGRKRSWNLDGSTQRRTARRPWRRRRQARCGRCAQDGYGSADVLRLARIAPPEIARGEVLVRVHAAGLDRGTWHVMTGRPYLLRLVAGVRAPRQPVAGLEWPARSWRSARE